ncbi:probable monoterpene synthase MTS1, chloroplastic isoform X2 [Humulus lupulus]|uniref:probable monoterpene synthase MTS1, chloroplastic isoform X2 n=1 Tax=Humulus lupulus TaxID=3486 RepID=UPI002B408B3D|nr:probable monoterpene synthase MTS1, chloroplastic isoform X2 [Humulus lupulus]
MSSLPVTASMAALPLSPSNNGQNIVRRSGNYKPALWDYDNIQSLQSIYTGEAYAERINKLKGEVRIILEKEVAENPLVKLEQMDTLHKLGISHHFQDEIRAILNVKYSNINDALWKKNDVYATALEFQVLRLHGYTISSEVFNFFKDGIDQDFKACLCDDVKGMLSLYEASFYSFNGETILDEARDFTTRNLKKYLMRHNEDQSSVDHDDDDFVILVEHALELPVHWRMRRLEARWFIDVYGKRHDMNPTFLELAKLDFNVLQSTYQEDLKHVSRWWSTTRLGEKLPFCRDRHVEILLWTVGMKFEAEFGYCRRMMAKIGVLFLIIDDIYDVYGTLDELQLFQDAIERWNINDLDQLPDYMKIVFLASYNVVNEIVYDLLKESGILIIKYIRKAWTDVCKSFMVEAKWYYNGYTPSLEEYNENGWQSSTLPLHLICFYCIIMNPITEESMECLLQNPTILRLSGILFRLVDDLGTSSDELKRGDNPKSIQCYMHENGVCDENDGREHIRNLINETWKQINEVRVANSPFSQTFIEGVLDFLRMAMTMYRNEEDRVGSNHDYSKNQIISLLFNPIPT